MSDVSTVDSLDAQQPRQRRANDMVMMPARDAHRRRNKPRWRAACSGAHRRRVILSSHDAACASLAFWKSLRRDVPARLTASRIILCLLRGSSAMNPSMPSTVCSLWLRFVGPPPDRRWRYPKQPSVLRSAGQTVDDFSRQTAPRTPCRLQGQR